MPKLTDAALDRRVAALSTKLCRGGATKSEHEELRRLLTEKEAREVRATKRLLGGAHYCQLLRMQTSFVQALIDELAKARFS